MDSYAKQGIGSGYGAFAIIGSTFYKIKDAALNGKNSLYDLVKTAVNTAKSTYGFLESDVIKLDTMTSYVTK